MRSYQPGVIRNVLTNWGAFVLSAVLSFVLSPFIVRTLGDTAYGAWVLLASVVGYLGLLDLGVRGAVTRYVARFHGCGEHERASQLTSAALTVFGIAAAVAVVFATILAAVLPRVFVLPPEFVAVARVVAIIGGVNVAVALLDGVFGGVVIGLQRFDVSNAVDVANGIVRTAVIVVALKLGGGLVALALVQLLTSVLRLITNFILCRRLYPELRVQLLGGDREHLRIVLSFGLASSVLHIAGQVMLYSDSVVIGAFLPVGLVTYFAIAANLTDYGRQIIGGISRVLTPLVSAIEVKGELAAVRNSLLRGARLTTLLILPVAVTFIVRGSTFINLWMGPEYGRRSGQVLAILAVFMTCHAGYQVLTASMMGINRHRGLIPVFLADAVANVALSIILVPRLGIIGSALGTLIPQLVVTLLVGPWYARRHLAIPMRVFWLDVHIRPALAILPFALVSVLVERYWPVSNLLVYFGQVVVALPFAALGAWLVALGAEERRIVWSALPRRVVAVQS